jgi:hypothetical protein
VCIARLVRAVATWYGRHGRDRQQTRERNWSADAGATRPFPSVDWCSAACKRVNTLAERCSCLLAHDAVAQHAYAVQAVREGGAVELTRARLVVRGDRRTAAGSQRAERTRAGVNSTLGRRVASEPRATHITSVSMLTAAVNRSYRLDVRELEFLDPDIYDSEVGRVCIHEPALTDL